MVAGRSTQPLDSTEMSSGTQAAWEVNVSVIASSLALFIAGAVLGASIDHWYSGAGNAWQSAGASLLIAVIAAENLRRRIYSGQGENRAV